MTPGRRGFGGGGFGFGPLPPHRSNATSCAPQGTPEPPPPPVAIPCDPPVSSPTPLGMRLDGAMLYMMLPGAEVGYFQREARVAFDPAIREAIPLIEYKVPSAQTILVSDVELYAQLGGDLVAVGERQLTGYVGFQFLVDGRVPIDLYSEISSSRLASDPKVRGSYFSKLGYVLGGADRQPLVAVRVREGQTLQLAYRTLATPAIPIAHIGGAVRGYSIPTAILSARSSA